MSESLITSPTQEGIPFPAMALVFPDAVNVRTPHYVPGDVLSRGDRAGGRFDLATEEVLAVSAMDANVYVSVNASGTLFSGSPRNWADARGHVPFSEPFDAHAARAALDALGAAYGLPEGALRDAKLTMVEGAVDLVVPRPAADYTRAAEDLSFTEPVRWPGTTLFKTTEWESVLYDPPAKFRKRKLPVPALYQEVAKSGVHVLRFEHTLKSGGVKRHLGRHKDADGEVRAGLLADARFRADLARLVLRRARALRFGRVAVADNSTMTSVQRRRWNEVRGIEASGGLDATLDAIRAQRVAGMISVNQEKHQLDRLRDLYRDPSLTRPADIQAEFEAALDAVAQTYTP